MAKGKKKEKRKAARKLVKKRLAAGKKVNVSKIAAKTGVNVKRAEKITTRIQAKAAAPVSSSSSSQSSQPANSSKPASNVSSQASTSINPKKYFRQNDPGEHLSKKEIKAAQEAGVNITKLNNYVTKNEVKTGNKASAFLQKQVNKVSTKLKHYDPTTAGGSGFGMKDIEYLMSDDGGKHSLEKVLNHMQKYDEESGVKIGNKAQEFMQGKLKEQKGNNNTSSVSSSSGGNNSSGNQDTRIGAPSQGELGSTIPKPGLGITMPKAPRSETKVDQSGRNNFSNTGAFIGNNNQGADFSVKIGGDASDNMKNAGKYMEINNNAHAKSQAQMNGLTRSAQAVETAATQTNSAERIANDDYLTRLQPMYMGARGKQSETEMFGDTFKFNTPQWQIPEPGKKPKDKTKKIAEMYKD